MEILCDGTLGDVGEALQAAADKMSAAVRCSDGVGGFYSDYRLVSSAEIDAPTSATVISARFGATNSQGTFVSTTGCGYVIRAYSRACTTSCPSPKQSDVDKNPCNCTKDGLNTAGNPLNLALQAKVQFESDYKGVGPFPLAFERRYRSSSSDDVIYLPNLTLGKRWRDNYDRFVKQRSFGSLTYVGVYRPDGRILKFQQSANGWTAPDDIEDTLVELTDGSGNLTGWQYQTADMATETYDATGRLTKIEDRSGMSQTLAYSTSATPPSVAPVAGLLISVTDDFGKQLSLTYNSAQRIETVVDPAGGVTSYAYNSDGVLASVTHPDASVRSSSTANPHTCRVCLTITA